MQSVEEPLEAKPAIGFLVWLQSLAWIKDSICHSYASEGLRTFLDRFLKGVVHMTKAIQIVDTRRADGGEQVILQSATYQGSAPFSGIFEVFDLDTCIHKGPDDGRTFVTVRCQFGDQNDEDADLVLEIPEGTNSVIGNIGSDVKVVKRIDFA